MWDNNLHHLFVFLSDKQEVSRNRCGEVMTFWYWHVFYHRQQNKHTVLKPERVPYSGAFENSKPSEALTQLNAVCCCHLPVTFLITYDSHACIKHKPVLFYKEKRFIQDSRKHKKIDKDLTFIREKPDSNGDRVTSYPSSIFWGKTRGKSKVK